MRIEPMLRGKACWVAFALALAGCAAGTEVEPPPGGTGGTGGTGGAGGGDQLTQTLTKNLEDQGYLVSQGYPILYQASDCEAFTYPLTENCYGNNPAAPYVAAVVKPWPDEYQDPAVADVMGGVVPGYTGVHRFDTREALVIYGRLPPPGKYFSLQTWVYSEEGHWSQSAYDYWAARPDRAVPMQYLFDTLPANDPESNRIQSFSAISNIVNNVVIERQSGASFGQIRYFVITPDVRMDRTVRRALAKLGVRDQDVFTEPVPPRDELGSIPIGLGKNADDFTTLMRYAVPEDPEAGQAWRQELPLTILRVRAQDGAPEPYPPLVFDRRTAVDEVDDAQLTSDFASLVRSVCDRARGAPWGYDSSGCDEPPPDSSVMKNLTQGYGWTGPYCRSIGMDCLGDQQDAAYYITPPNPLDEGEVYAVVGTLATETGNATYSALSVNDPSLFKGSANVLDSVLAGSASSYAATVRDPDKLYVWFFARDCDAIADLTDGHCTTITPEMVPLRGDTTAPGDPTFHGMFQVGLRDYVKPGTARGPDATKLVTPHILTFRPAGTATTTP